MFGLYANTGKSFGDGSTSLKRAKVIDKKEAPARGYKRVLVKEDGFCAKIEPIDVAIKTAKKIEKTKTYDFEVRERNKSGFGSKTYICDQAKEVTRGSSDLERHDFSQNSQLTKSRTQFSRV
jgi:hypothetical protein